jgi:hypothetical protein
MAVLHGRWRRVANYRGAYDAVGEEFDLARSPIVARATVRFKQRGKRQKTQRHACRESERTRPPNSSWNLISDFLGRLDALKLAA